MKYLLIINTAGSKTELAIGDEKNILVQRTGPADPQASRLLLQRLDQLFQEIGINLTDIKRVAVCHGPGGYSQLRAGIVTGALLSFALGTHLVGVPDVSLIEILKTAWQINPQEIVKPQYT